MSSAREVIILICSEVCPEDSILETTLEREGIFWMGQG